MVSLPRSFVVGELLYDVHGEDRKHHHAERGEQDGDDLPDGRDGEYLGSHRGHVHPGPPEGVAETVEFVIDQHLVVEKDQGREVGKDHYGDDIGPKEEFEPVIDHPVEHDVKGEEGAQQGGQADEHGPVARQVGMAPMDDIQIGHRQQQKEEISDEKAPLARRGGHAHEKVEEEYDADDELQRQIPPRKMFVIPGNDFPRYRNEQHHARQQCEQAHGPLQRGVVCIGIAFRGFSGRGCSSGFGIGFCVGHNGMRFIRSAFKINASCPAGCFRDKFA